MPVDRRGSVAGVVLAAGSSTRMGSNKLLLDIDGEPMLRHVAGRAVGAGLDPVLVVLGFEAERLAPALEGLTCSVLVNGDYERGMNSSFCCGLARVPEDASAVVIMLGDMPFITAAMIRALVAKFRGTDTPLVVSRYGHVTAPPTLFSRSLFPEFRVSDGDGCGKEVVSRYRDAAVEVPLPASVITDLDVPRDYERVKTLLAIGP